MISRCCVFKGGFKIDGHWSSCLGMPDEPWYTHLRGQNRDLFRLGVRYRDNRPRRFFHCELPPTRLKSHS